MTGNGASGPEEIVEARTDPGSAVSLPFVALVLGISATVLGLTVIWFFAAIPLGIAAVVVGVMANRRGAEGRHHTRAVLGLVLGTVAILLGITGAVFMPRFMARMDAALGNVENDVTDDIEMIDSSVSSDVNRLDKSMARDLRRLDAANRANLLQFEHATSETLTRLEQRIAETSSTLSAEEKEDLSRLEAELRRDLGALESSLRGADQSLVRELSSLEARVDALEREVGL